MTTATTVAAPAQPDWLTPKQIRARTGRSVSRIREALENGRLHGHQPVFRGRWSVHPDAVAAWVAEQTPAQQEQRCACRPVEPPAPSRPKGARR